MQRQRRRVMLLDISGSAVTVITIAALLLLEVAVLGLRAQMYQSLLRSPRVAVRADAEPQVSVHDARAP